MLDLLDLFKSLQSMDAPLTGDARFLTFPINGYENHRIGKDESVCPSILLSVTTAQVEMQVLAPIRLMHLSIQYDLECCITRHDGSKDRGIFTVIKCINADPLLHSYFLRIMGPLVEALGNTPSRSEVSETINNLIELFRAMAEPPKKSVQGLWSELLLIAVSRNPTFLIRAWHENLEDLYDFTFENQCIEVKSAIGKERQHYFSLDQLQPPTGTVVIVASLLIERTGADTSLSDLMELVRSRVNNDPQLVAYIDRIVVLTLGNSWQQAQRERYNRTRAEESLAFFDTSKIPKIDSPLPAEVTDVHFKSDLTNQPQIDLKHYKKLGNLFRAL